MTSDNSLPLKGKVAIVTGSTKGIGKGIAEALSSSGANVVVTSRHIDDARDLAKRLSSEFEKSIGLQLDIEDRSTFSPLLEDILAEFGRLDALVNNAFSHSGVPPLDVLDDQQVEFALTSNITNTLLLTRKCLDALKESKGNVINISSVAANRHLYGMPIYGIIKGAINHMTKALAAEWAQDQIRVNAISPGFVYSSALTYFGVPEDVIAKHYEYCKQFHPLGRIGTPEDIGKLAAFVASDDAGFMTGSVINSDAGYSIQGVKLPM